MGDNPKRKKKEMRGAKEKRGEKKKIEKEDNFVRKWSRMFAELPFIKHFDLKSIVKGSYYLAIHTALIAGVVFVTLFNTSILHLIVLLIIVSLDAISIVLLHGCPLTYMEQKYLGVNGMDCHRCFLQNLHIGYQCDHNYESQVELLINVWSIIAFKILVLIVFKTCNVQLVNFYNLYTNSPFYLAPP